MSTHLKLCGLVLSVPSSALSALLAALPEVDHLLGAYSPTQPLRRTERAQAIRRATTVVLSSHYERYVYAVNEEAVDAVNAAAVLSERLPRDLRLYHTKPAVERLAGTSWEAEPRVTALESFVREEAWLWIEGSSGGLQHGRLLEFMTAPKPDAVRRYFRTWDIPDIFSAITRTPHVRAKVYVGLLDLVDKRNAIAHGDVGVVPTHHDVVKYRGAVRTFCTRADKALARRMEQLLGVRPW